MARSTNLTRLAMATLALVTAAAVNARAQSSDGPQNARADALHQRAVQLHEQPARAADAARLHVAEARARGYDDPQSVECLIMAGRLYSYAGETRKARRTMEFAADRALDIGDVVTAAHAYLDAAVLALRADDQSGARKLVTRARTLSGSPVLAVNDRLDILRRIEPSTPTVVVRP